jgi:NADH dehydrogenase FAD-containing subunit
MGKHLVLVGAGTAHVDFLDRWARRPEPSVRVTLVTKQRRFLDPALLPYWIEGRMTIAQPAIEIEALVHRAKAIRPDAQAMQLDATACTLQLDDARQMRYDWISCDLEPVQSRALTDIAIAGARKNGLFVRPLEAFLTLWPQVLALAASRPISLAVIADAQGGFEALPLCFAIRQRLPGAAVSLVTGGEPLARGQPQALQDRLGQLLRQRNITVLADRATAIEPGDVHLKSGARLACDVPLMHTRTHPPEWLTQSGMAGADAASGQSPSLVARNLMATVLERPLLPSRPKKLTMLPVAKAQALTYWGQGGGRGWVWQGYLPGWLAKRDALALSERCRSA